MSTPLRAFDIGALSRVVYESRQEGSAEIVVVVPLYNYAHTIGEALATIVKQDFQPLSVIVVDDCSRDAGAQTAAGFLEQQRGRFIEARVIRHDRNQGPSLARNS